MADANGTEVGGFTASLLAEGFCFFTIAVEKSDDWEVRPIHCAALRSFQSV